jgi:hypothetical protein
MFEEAEGWTPERMKHEILEETFMLQYRVYRFYSAIKDCTVIHIPSVS